MVNKLINIHIQYIFFTVPAKRKFHGRHLQFTGQILSATMLPPAQTADRIEYHPLPHTLEPLHSSV